MQDADRAGKEEEVALIEKAGKIKELRQKLKVEDELDCLLTLKEVKTQIRSKMESVKRALEQQEKGNLLKAYSDSYPFYMLEDLLNIVEKRTY